MRKRRLAGVKLCVQATGAGAKGLSFTLTPTSEFKALQLIYHSVLCVSEMSRKGVLVETVTPPSDKKIPAREGLV